MPTSSEIIAVLPVRDVGRVHKRGGGDGRDGKRWWRELTVMMGCMWRWRG